ncbi:MAG: hypothetical protein IJV62_02720 [Eggerthellaceae bacterium]|nr:hypothetical protein [Eggerthellaceae bacterium]
MENQQRHEEVAANIQKTSRIFNIVIVGIGIAAIVFTALAVGFFIKDMHETTPVVSDSAPGLLAGASESTNEIQDVEGQDEPDEDK